MIGDGGAVGVEPEDLHRFELARASWSVAADRERRATAAQVARWANSAAALSRKEGLLTAEGRWLGGARTLMAAMRMQHREVPLTAGFAWVLRPDGHHRLGKLALDGLLEHLGLAECGAPNRVRVVTEDHREGTRADLVVYGPDFTIVVEAKTFAREQPSQLERLEGLWEHDPGPVFVFLTRGERLPNTARAGGAKWNALTWAQTAAITGRAAEAAADPAPGVREFIATLEAHHHD